MRVTDRLPLRALLVLTALLLLLAFGTPAHAAPTGFRVENGRLLEASGNDFVMRGVNHAPTWHTDRISSLAHIKARGANTVRVVLSSGDRWTANDTADVADVVAQCKRNRLICVLFQGEVTVRNTGSSAIDGWTLNWAFSGAQRITNMWGGTPAQTGSEVSVASAPYTAAIPAAGSVTLGFTATTTDRDPSPSAFTLNGSACSVA